MKKMIINILVLMLVLSTVAGALVSSKTSTKPPIEPIVNMNYSHTILGEYGTATWCGYCKYAHEALMNIYGGGWHPFYYISLVCDVNTNAYQRAISELGLSGYPTVYFDGGYQSVVGAGSVPGAQTAYNSSIVACGERDVSDVDISLDVTWNGNAEMDIEVSIDNNEDSTYDGHLHVYVTEIESSMGWYDTGGKLYTFPFLDYAFNEDISVSAGGTWQDSVNWDGHDYNNGYGDDFGDISYGNIMIIAAIFDSDTSYVDDTTGFRVGDNSPPNTPSNPNPEDESSDVEIETKLSWTGGDPDSDVLSYDVYFGESSSPPLVASDCLGTSYDPGLLDFDTTYYWKIVAKDPYGASTSGPVWSFSTRGNDPPNTPSDPDPENDEIDVNISTDLSWTGGDPDDDDVTYDVYFGITSPPPKIKSNKSDTSYNLDLLDFDTSYYWKIVAWDEYNYSSSGPIWSFTTEENEPPYEPSNPIPEDGATEVSIKQDLYWDGGDPNSGDSAIYDVYFGESSPPPKVSSNQTFTTYNLDTLDLDTTYYWRIVSWDNQELSTSGPIWHFTTQLEPNEPPNKPTIDGPSSGKPGQEYDFTFSVIDPNDDDVYFHIEWGDGSTEEWVGTYESGENAILSHTWDEEKTYTITVKAKDIFGDEGPEETLEVTMPKNKPFNFNFNLLEWLFERFPNAFPIIRYLLGI